MFNPGRLTKKIQVYGKTKALNELKETVYNENSLIATTRAEIVPQTGKLQNQQVDTILTHVTNKIIIRFNKKIMEAYQDEETKKSIYIKFKTHRFEVKYILNPYFQNKFLEVFVEEVIG